jgi:mRNA deadenylase 3'-5' endonuclease subunit Ccr4
LRSKVEREGRHYQGWLDYVYFDSQRLTCKGVQEALTATELYRIYDDGDALPNEWHPSDHLPVAAVFSLE